MQILTDFPSTNKINFEPYLDNPYLILTYDSVQDVWVPWNLRHFEKFIYANDYLRRAFNDEEHSIQYDGESSYRIETGIVIEYFKIVQINSDIVGLVKV